jgi:membrane dipeptidase
MNQVGMTLDCTHMGRRSTLELMDLSSRPVVFSHSNARAVFEHPRNIADEQIIACAATDGVVGIAGWGPIVNKENDVSDAALAAHLLYIADLVGAQHVAIGRDYVYEPELTTARVRRQPEWYVPEGGTLEDWNYHHEVQAFAPPTVFVGLTEAMLAKGFTDSEISGVLGENWLRVARANWPEGDNARP